MKWGILFFLLSSSFFGHGQSIWNGAWYVDYESPTAESKVDIWVVPDSLHGGQTIQRWSFKQFFSKKLSWEYTGYTVAKDSNTLALFLETLTSFISTKEAKVERFNNRFLKKIDKTKPFYIITKDNGSFYIETKQRKGRKRINPRLIKTV